MADVQAGWINILEASTVTVTSAGASYPAYRLYDRNPSRLWQATSTATQTIHADQGSSPVSIDTLAVPSGHNLNGCTLNWQWSDDNSSWSNAVAQWVQSGSALIRKTASSALTHRYWRFTIAGASADPEAAEVFMTLLNAFYAQPKEIDGIDFGLIGNRTRNESKSGVVQVIINGEDRQLVNYEFTPIDPSELATFQAWDAEHQGAKAFFFIDHAGAEYFAEIVSDEGRLKFKRHARGYLGLSVNIQQVL